MNTHTQAIAGGAVAVAVVLGVIFYLQNFNAQEVACNAIGEARAELQAQYEAGVNASVQVFAEEKAVTDERLNQCLHAKPTDPCADAQKARDAAVEKYNGIASPADNAPYAEFQTYFNKREDAYQNYKKAKDALDQCRSVNPPKAEVPYEQSDTKACFDAYDASVQVARDTFDRDTRTMRTALTSALSALDAREKACNPPKGKEKFTDPPPTDGGEGQTDGPVPVEIANCKMINESLDTELFMLRKRAATIPVEIQGVEDSIENIQKRMSPLRRDLADVDTYIPPESAKTQFEGALNALRAERKVAIEASLDFYNKLLARREAEKTALQEELADVNAKIQARLEQIRKENEARQRAFPTSLRLAKPDECEYYHCHGLLCGKPDPAPNKCGHGSTEESDIDCKKFFDSYLQSAGGN
ncbi:hypothetical protein K2P56_01805 [Patescibacteria group bacterium]|nr:hypothetical protein [Patescibacteria group bacterium]